MKPAGLLLLLPVGIMVASGLAQPPSGLVSPETKAHIMAGLPSYRPPAPNSERADAEAPQSTDPGVLILPKLTVKEKRLPNDAADRLMSRRDFNRKMENLYFDTLAEAGPLNVILNYLTIPLLSPSKAARGRAIYEAQELDRLRHINAVSRFSSPEAAAKFEQELDNQHTTRPAGTR